MSQDTATYCPTVREETPRYDRFNGTFDPEPTVWAPGCGHAACVADDHDGFHDWDCPVAVCRSSALLNDCELPAGHDGEHQFPPPTQPEQPAAGGGR